MPSGQSDSKCTNKTEFQRYLDMHPEISLALIKRHREYRAIYIRGTTFGYWLRQKYLKDFVHAYRNWWLKKPELHPEVYKQEVLSV